MNNYIIKQKDIEILMQSDKTLYYKLELLNKDLKIIDCVEGNLISDNISISSSSDVRRTYNCELVVTDSTFDIGCDKKVWFDKRIRPYIGILHQRTQEVVYYLLGTFLFTDANYNYDTSTHTLSLTCNDMMCLLNGVRGGNLNLYQRTILEGTDARTIIIDLLNEIGITKYFIEFNINNDVLSTFKIPYDMVYNAGMTAYQIIKDIVDLYPGTEMYFSKEGVFMIDRIPTGKNEPVILNDEIIQPILISEQLNTSFSNVFNHIEIWGKVNEPDYYSQEVSVSNNVYASTIVTSKLNEDDNSYTDVYYDEYDNFDVFALRIPETNKENQQININNLGNVPIHNDKGEPLPINYLDANTDCIFRYREDTNDFLYVGQYQCYAECYLTNNINDTSEKAVINIDNEFAIEKIGTKLKVLSGGDFDKIPTNSLCLQRCRYELYNATNKQKNLTITTIAIPWLDVNQLIEYTLNSNNTKQQYMINNISCNYSNFTMNITCNGYYPEYI